MNTAVARSSTQVLLDWQPVPMRDDAQLQNLLKAGWLIEKEGTREITLTKERGGQIKRMVHKRKRA